MDLYRDILIQVLRERSVQMTFPDLPLDTAVIVEGRCYQTIKRIKAVIENDSLEDSEYFMKIEEIISALEALGTGCGTRHDFG